jgi:hypothetical protein
MKARILAALGIPALLLGGLAVGKSIAPAGKADSCCGGAARLTHTQATPVAMTTLAASAKPVSATDQCPPCPQCP